MTRLLGHKTVLLNLHAGIGAECAVRAIEIFAVLGIIHQVNPEPRGSRRKRDATGTLIYPTAVIRVSFVYKEGWLVRDRTEGILNTIARHSTIIPSAEKQYRSV